MRLPSASLLFFRRCEFLESLRIHSVCFGLYFLPNLFLPLLPGIVLGAGEFVVSRAGEACTMRESGAKIGNPGKGHAYEKLPVFSSS